MIIHPIGQASSKLSGKLSPRGAKQREFRHVRVKWYPEFFIAAAFLTSCDSQPPPQGTSQVRIIPTAR
ncbi:protein of unknown function [Aminobacter niigataensis]|nr:protein of unknown function [Aminobacter niigataensis]